LAQVGIEAPSSYLTLQATAMAIHIIRQIWKACLLLLLIKCHASVPPAIAASSSCLGDDMSGVTSSPSHSLSLSHVSLLQTRLIVKKVEAHGLLQHDAAVRRQLGNDLLRHPGVFDDAVAEYARHYHAQLSQSSMVFFLHVSKTAGTFLCGVGYESGCREAGGGGPFANCHLRKDGYAWGKDGIEVVRHRPDTCAGLSKMYSADNVTLEGNENYLIQEGLCPEFWNVMIFRDPKSRLMSHLSMWQSDEFKDDAQYWSSPENLTSAKQLFDNAPIISNNYFIRTLLGASVFTLPFGSITSAHLEEAKRVLEGFDVLLIVDENNATLLETDVRATLGLEVSKNTSPGEVQKKGSPDSFIQSLRWTSTDWDLVDAANALDSELWQHAKALHLLDQQVFRHPAFSQVSAAMPRAPCGYLSK